MLSQKSNTFWRIFTPSLYVLNIKKCDVHILIKYIFGILNFTVDNIYQKGPDPKTNEYSIPLELSANKELILLQIKLLEKLFPKDTSNTKRKEENPQGSSSSQTRDDSNLSKKQKITRNIKDYIPVVVEKGQMARKLKAAAPYNFFLTAITDSKPTHNEMLTVTMQGFY